MPGPWRKEASLAQSQTTSQRARCVLLESPKPYFRPTPSTNFRPDSWAGTFKNGEYFKDKIVLVGPQGDWTKDELMTPWGLMNGAEIHLNAMNDLLEKDFLYPASEQLVFATVVGSAAIALLLGLLIVPIAWRFLAAAGVLGGYTAVVIWAFNGPGWILPWWRPSASSLAHRRRLHLRFRPDTDREAPPAHGRSSATTRRTW